MQTARVIGRATSTVKHPSMDGWKLLIAQPLDRKGGPDGAPQLVIDGMGARKGDEVILTSDGNAVRDLVGADNTPIRWMVMGLVDER